MLAGKYVNSSILKRKNALLAKDHNTYNIKAQTLEILTVCVGDKEGAFEPCVKRAALPYAKLLSYLTVIFSRLDCNEI